MVNLTFGELRKPIEAIVGLVDDMENLATLAPGDQFLAGEFLHAQVVSLFYHLRNLHDFLRHMVTNLHQKLQVIVVFLKPTEFLYMLWVIRIVVVDIHGGKPVETLDHHSLAVHIGEPQGTCYLSHASLSSPLLNGIHQGLGNLQVVDEVEVAKPHLLHIPTLVGFLVEDSRYPSHNFPLLVGQEKVGLTKLESRVLVFPEGGYFIGKEKRHSMRAVSIQVVIKLHESLKIVVAFYFPNLNSSHIKSSSLHLQDHLHDIRCECLGLLHGSRLAVDPDNRFGIGFSQMYPLVGEVDLHTIDIIHLLVFVE